MSMDKVKITSMQLRAFTNGKGNLSRCMMCKLNSHIIIMRANVEGIKHFIVINFFISPQQNVISFFLHAAFSLFIFFSRTDSFDYNDYDDDFRNRWIFLKFE